MKKEIKKNRKKKRRNKWLFIFPILITIVMIIGIGYCYINTSPVSKKSDEVTIKIEQGSSVRNIGSILKKEGLIRDEKFLLLYVKINKLSGFQAGNYVLDKKMPLKEILMTLQEGSNIKNKEITVTFIEGKTMRILAKTIDKSTVNTEDDVYKLLADKEYIKSLIKDYWFLDDTILDENIYYPLEGYLSPNTYNFKAEATVDDIFRKLLNQTGTLLEKYKTEIESSSLSVHQIITLASMVEGEGVTLEDRKNIAGVFINRINLGMSLGSDVTTYYAAKIELGERDLYKSELNSNNPYNTRSASNAGKLPIGPICNPSEQAIESVIGYTQNDYLYFVADKNMKVYFNKTDAEHNKTIKELKSSGLWYEY